MDRNIDFLLNIRLQKIRRESYPSLTFSQLKYVINHTKWLIYRPTSLSQAARDIETLSVEEIVEFLTDKEMIRQQLDEVNEKMNHNIVED